MIVNAKKRLVSASDEDKDMELFFNMVSDLCEEYGYDAYDYIYKDQDMSIWARSKDKSIKIVLEYLNGKWDLGFIKGNFDKVKSGKDFEKVLTTMNDLKDLLEELKNVALEK